MAKQDNYYQYSTASGLRTGTFSIYQGKDGAIYLAMANNAVMLSKRQAESLIGSSLYDLKDFSIEDYNAHYDDFDKN